MSFPKLKKPIQLDIPREGTIFKAMGVEKRRKRKKKAKKMMIKRRKNRTIKIKITGVAFG